MIFQPHFITEIYSNSHNSALLLLQICLLSDGHLSLVFPQVPSCLRFWGAHWWMGIEDLYPFFLLDQQLYYIDGMVHSPTTLLVSQVWFWCVAGGFRAFSNTTLQNTQTWCTGLKVFLKGLEGFKPKVCCFKMIQVEWHLNKENYDSYIVRVLESGRRYGHRESYLAGSSHWRSR